MKTISCSEFTHLGKEIISDFYSCLQENVEHIELCINKLDSSEDPDLVHDLFGAIHSLKGNCRMVLLTPFVNVTHELEEVVSEMRNGERHYHHLYGSVFITIITVIDILINQLIQHEECNGEVLTALEEQIAIVKAANPSTGVDDLTVAEKALAVLIQLQDHPLEAIVTEDSDSAEKTLVEEEPLEGTDDIQFFKEFALQLDSLTIYRQGRTEELLNLCVDINHGLGDQVCQKQLTAAVYIHDIGMAFIPSAIISKNDKLTKEETAIIHQHINLGAHLLLSISGWEEASKIVEQHHERFDGSGYPAGLKSDEIHLGATILALADTYCAITNKRNDRSYKKTLFSAVTLINCESGKQFDPQAVEVFNDTIRKLYITSG